MIRCGRPMPAHVGLTLVETMVVIAIVGVLAALAIPAVQYARESSRKLQCTSRLHNLALSVAQFESLQGRYPGYQEEIATGPGPIGTHSRKCASWATVLLPFLERVDLFDRWNDPAVEVTTELFTKLEFMICPSARGEAPWDNGNYIANAGFSPSQGWDPAPYGLTGTAAWHWKAQRAANGVFHDRYPKNWQTWASVHGVPVPSLPKTRSEDFYDGRSRTILLTENVQSNGWFLTGPLVNNGTYDAISALNYVGRNSVVALWYYATEVKAPVTNPAGPPVLIPPAWFMHINADKKARGTTAARPSSHHGSGVNMAFADGHVEFVSEEITYYAYQQLMTPHGRKSDMPDPEFLLDKP